MRSKLQSKRGIFINFSSPLIIAILLINNGFCASTPITIVNACQSKAVIVIPNNSTDQVRAAALVLSKYIDAATNAKLPITSETDAVAQENAIKIWIGQSNYVLAQKIDFS